MKRILELAAFYAIYFVIILPLWTYAIKYDSTLARFGASCVVGISFPLYGYLFKDYEDTNSY